MAWIFKRGDVWWKGYRVAGSKTPIRESLHTKDRRIANLKLLEHEVKHGDRSAPSRRPTNPTVQDFIEAVKAWDNERLGEYSIRNKLRAWNALVAFTGAKRVGDISRHQIEDWAEHLRATPSKRTGKPVSAWTVNNYLKDVRAIMNRGIKLRLYTDDNPAAGYEKLRISKSLPDFHTHEDMLKLLRAAELKTAPRLQKDPDTRDRPDWAILLCGFAGLRKREMSYFRKEWLNFDQDTIEIRRVVIDGQLVFDLKDHEERAVPMSKRLREAFASLRGQTGFLLDSGRPSSYGRFRYDPRKTVEDCLAICNLPTDHPFQRLRRSFGSVALQKGASIYEVSRWLGHSTVAVTQGHYTGLLSRTDAVDLM